MHKEDRHQRNASIIAASITFGVALILLVLLFVLTVGDDRRALSETSIPEMQDDEEIYLEPDFIITDDAGEDVEEEAEEAAAQPPGLQDPAAEEQTVKIVKNDVVPEQPPVSNKDKLVSTDKPSDVKTSVPKVSTEDEKRLASVSGKFKTDNNGANTAVDSPGSVSASGTLSGKGNNGRKMLSIPKQTVGASQKVTVKVQITVGENGNVKTAKAISGGTEKQRSACEKMARQSKWTPATGVGDVTGTITFTINPK